jgi:Transposase DDE domain
LKIYGEGEWLDQKHGIRSRRRWRKLPLGVDARTHEIVAEEFTPDDVGDISELPDLLDQIGADVASVTADGAYDGVAVYDAVAERRPEATQLGL